MPDLQPKIEALEALRIVDELSIAAHNIINQSKLELDDCMDLSEDLFSIGRSCKSFKNHYRE